MNTNELNKVAENIYEQVHNGASVSDIIQLLTEFQAGQKPSAGVWVKASERLPDRRKEVFCKDEKGIKYSCFYVDDFTEEIEFEDDEFTPDYVHSDAKKGILTLKAGWYEECENVGYYDYVIHPRKIIKWIDESQSIQQKQLSDSEIEKLAEKECVCIEKDCSHKSSFIKGFKAALQTNVWFSEDDMKDCAVDFFYYWWNTKGNNTKQGFDEWFTTYKQQKQISYGKEKDNR